MGISRDHQSLAQGWEFCRMSAADDLEWASVVLPHNPFIANLDGGPHWQGLCRYRRRLQGDGPFDGCRYVLYFEGAMHSASVQVDGELAGIHRGGYLPFEIDVTRWLRDGEAHELVVELDNRNNADVPPGKALEDLDFCWYGGLYRRVELRRYPNLHFTDPVSANAAASGGLFIRTLAADSNEARIAVRTHVRNGGEDRRDFRLCLRVSRNGEQVASLTSTSISLRPGQVDTSDFELVVREPALWNLDDPQLYHLDAVAQNMSGEIIDGVRERFGIRRIDLSRSGGLRLNGRRIRPRGVNRHQDYPRVGYAISRAAQYRDAKRIKEAGFDYVRLSHYPQSPDFLDACDELGILVMNCIPGWQFSGGEAFRSACCQNARDLIRRDRNHPSAFLWELSLNETEFEDAFAKQLHEIGHEEYPGDQMFTCGWIDRYDVFIHARQHGQIHTWKNGDKPLVIAEYGDWEFYAANHGFNQKRGSELLAEWSNSRVLRGDGERRQLQQARNHIHALNDTLATVALCDGLWSMYDYPRGYSLVRAACGVMDFYRLPKYSYYFYRSQRPPTEDGGRWSGGPVVFLATYWTPSSSLDIYVFSNCEEVELRLNDRIIKRTHAGRTSSDQNLPFPPFVFHIDRFEAGELVAEGYVDGMAVASHAVATPGEPVAVEIEVCDEGVSGILEEGDVLLAHARILDERRQLCVGSEAMVTFSVNGGACVVGPTTVHAEAGIATAVIRRYAGLPQFAVAVRSPGLAMGKADYWLQPGEEPRENSAIAVAQD